MTREEYIDFANALKNNYTIDFDKLPEFCDMAISALSESKGELISRQAVEEINSEIPKIHELFDIAYEYNKEDSTRTELSQKCTTYLLDMWQTLGAIVDNYPSIENKGEWIFYDEEFYPQGRFASVNHRIRECSICHHKIADFVGNMDFCPNCGADMRGDT